MASHHYQKVNHRMLVTDAIERSCQSGDIVRISADDLTGTYTTTEDARAELRFESEDEAEGDTEHEFWGTDDDGFSWRVHLATVPTIVRCMCGEATGTRCAWTGPSETTVTVEWMPDALRAEHITARNRGTYPHNGARHLACCPECSDMLIEADPEWCESLP